MKAIFTLIAALLLLLAASACQVRSAPRLGAGKPETGRVLFYHEWESAEQRRFHLWRADQPEGPFARVTKEPASAIGGRGPVLVAEDRIAPMGQDLFYYLTEVTADGRESKVTDIIRARATIPNLESAKPGPNTATPKKAKASTSTPAARQGS